MDDVCCHCRRFCAEPHQPAHLYHTKFAQERLCLRDLVEQKRGSVLCDEDADVVWQGVCNGVHGYIPRESVHRVWVDHKCRMWIARTACAPLEVRHRNMYTLETRRQQHLEYIIRCINDSAAWHRRTTACPLSVCDVAFRIANRFGDAKFYTKRTIEKQNNGATIRCAHVFHDITRMPDACKHCHKRWLNCTVYTFLCNTLGDTTGAHGPELGRIPP